jgi:hypothetical protein
MSPVGVTALAARRHGADQDAKTRMTWNATSAWSLTPSCANCVSVNTDRARPVLGPQLGQAFDPSNTDHAETVSAVNQITGGNFRLIERLMTQIARVMGTNQLEAITPDVVHAARQILVIGAQ